MFIREKTLKNIIDRAVESRIRKRFEELTEESNISTYVDVGNGRVYWTRGPLKNILKECVQEIIDAEVNEIGKRINDDINQESLIDSIVDRINKKQIK